MKKYYQITTHDRIFAADRHVPIGLQIQGRKKVYVKIG